MMYIIISINGLLAIERVNNSVTGYYIADPQGTYFVFTETEMRTLEVARQELEFLKQNCNTREKRLSIIGLYNTNNTYSLGFNYLLF